MALSGLLLLEQLEFRSFLNPADVLSEDSVFVLCEHGREGAFGPERLFDGLSRLEVDGTWDLEFGSGRLHLKC